MNKIFRNRLSIVLKIINSSGAPAAFLISSAPERSLSRDTSLPYRQSSDFFYLTGSHGKELALLFKSGEKRPFLYAPPSSKERELWEGKAVNARALSRDLGAELVITRDPEKEILKQLSGTESLYFQNEAGTLGWKIAQGLMGKPSHQRHSMPSRFLHSDNILTGLRLYKDEEEIKNIRRAAEVTNAALFEILPLIKNGTAELEIAAALEHFYRLNGCEAAFPPIVASGVSAATLHHEPGHKKLKNGELLMLDIGASFDMYAADITRVIPVSGFFSVVQRQIYGFVLEAQKAAIKKVRHGVLVKDVYEAAAFILLEGLRELGIVKGSLASLKKNKAWKRHFPHSIGHSLGLDTHDIGNLRANENARLEAGMVFTIEPGLYFPKKLRSIMPLGIRIEDDVLVTKGSCIVLSEGFPKAPADIESLL